MYMTRVKICGLMNNKDTEICVNAGVHVVGFVTEYPVPVPWNLTREQTARLVEQVPPFVGTCVVTGGSVHKVMEIAKAVRPDIIQLHYRETLEEITAIAGCMKAMGIRTVKALRVDENGRCDFEIPDPAEAVKKLEETGISAIVADSYTSTMPGGTGIPIKLDTYRLIRAETSLPVILAGGINPSNVAGIIGDAAPYAVDVLTGVENKPGQKDAAKIDELMRLCSHHRR
jgi:phosphoribosylanthranilate isomerase